MQIANAEREYLQRHECNRKFSRFDSKTHVRRAQHLNWFAVCHFIQPFYIHLRRFVRFVETSAEKGEKEERKKHNRTQGTKTNTHSNKWNREKKLEL